MFSRTKSMSRLWIGAALFTAGMFAVVLSDVRTAEEGDKVIVPHATTYLGELQGAPETARIAFVVEEQKFVAYICSSDNEFNQGHSRWFRGDITDGKFSVTVDGIALEGTLKGDTVAGTLKRDKSHGFTAKAIAGDANAGLFRAGENVEDTDYVVGWIADEKGLIVGTGAAAKGKGKVATLQPPKGNNNIAAKLATKNGNVVADAGKVGGAAAGAKAAPVGRKFDKAAQNESIQDLVALRRAQGGNPVQAMLIQQMRRLVAGKQPETDLERKVFAELQKAPRDMMQAYLKDWDALPQGTKDSILGPSGKQLNVNTALDAVQSRRLITEAPVIKNARKGGVARTLTGSVKSVTIPTVTCVDETNPEIIGKDEVFAIHTVIVGNGAAVSKQTAILTGFDDGVTKAFQGADAQAFPGPGQAAVEGAEVFIVTTLYEDDGGDIAKAIAFLKPVIQAAVILTVESLNGKEKTLNELEKAGIKLAVDAALTGVAAGLGNLFLQALGTDSIVARPDGTVVAENGGPKNKMVFQKIKNGDVKYKYELSGFNVQR